MKLSRIINIKSPSKFLLLFFLIFVILTTIPDIIEAFSDFNTACMGIEPGVVIRVMGLKKIC